MPHLASRSLRESYSLACELVNKVKTLKEEEKTSEIKKTTERLEEFIEFHRER